MDIQYQYAHKATNWGNVRKLSTHFIQEVSQYVYSSTIASFYLINYLKASLMFSFYEMQTFSYLNILL